MRFISPLIEVGEFSLYYVKKFSDKKEAEIFYKKLQTALINGDTVFEVEDEIK